MLSLMSERKYKSRSLNKIRMDNVHITHDSKYKASLHEQKLYNQCQTKDLFVSRAMYSSKQAFFPLTLTMVISKYSK